MAEEGLLNARPEVTPWQSTGAVFATLCVGHLAVDFGATLVNSSLGLIEVRSRLIPEQSAWLLGVGTLTSGLAQPITAVVGDRLQSRMIAVLGVLLAGVGFGLLGFAQNLPALAAIYTVGMVGAGMFHPIAATTIAQLQESRRNFAAGAFYVAGMIGGVSGAMFWPRWLSQESGFEQLPLVVLPFLVLALAVHRGNRSLPPLQTRNRPTVEQAAVRKNWGSILVLYCSSALRYCVNTALVYLYLRWVQQGYAAEHVGWTADQVAKAAAPVVGNLNAMTILGMALGSLLAGTFVSPGKEKLPMVVVPLAFAPVVAFLPHLGIHASYVMGILAGIGFSAMFPISVAMAQHLLPHRANLAASLMMGGAWAVATLGPRFAEYGVTHWGVENTFLLTAIVLAASGLVALGLRSEPQPADTCPKS
jgi:MFS family permease